MTTEGMGDFFCKNYKIYKASKLVNEWNVLVKILCYQTNTCGGKYINDLKSIQGNNMRSIPRKYDIKRSLT